MRSGTAFPLVPTQVQLWIRELRRLGRLVFDRPVFTWLDEPTQEYPSLPAFHCSECGVRFYGAVNNQHQGANQELRLIEVVRPAI